MATTTYDDNTFAVRSIGSRTNSGGTPVSDITAEEDRLAVSMLTEGWLKATDSFAVIDGLAGTWTINIGSDGARTDYYIVEGQELGQGNYLVRLAAKKLVTLSAANPTLDRIDEVYLVVTDSDYDGVGVNLARLAVRQGDASVAPVVPGPDAGWEASSLLATIEIPAGSADIKASTITDEREQTQLLVDAATLDGLAASYFALATHNHDTTYTDLAHVGSTDGHPIATDSLDGFMDSSEKFKLDDIETGAQVNRPAGEILAALKTVDGNGSGLDADLLDGLQGSDIATAGHLHNAEYYLEGDVNGLVAEKRNKPEAVMLKLFTPTALASGSADIVPCTTERDDWGGVVGTLALVDADQTGYYLVAYQVHFQANSSGYRQLRLYQSNPSGRTLQFQREKAVTGGEGTIINGSFIWYGTATQYVALEAYQTSGSSLNLEANLTWFRVLALGN